MMMAHVAVDLLLTSNMVLSASENMNGIYYIQPGNSTDSSEKPATSFNTNFSSYPALGRPDNVVKYVDAYSEEISTLYSQVWWTMGPIYNFSSEFRKEFDDKTMAIVGYEFDQVIQNADGTESPVPVTWSYNHHYSARVVGKYAEMYQEGVDGPQDPRAKNMGHLSGPHDGKPASVWQARSTKTDPTPNSPIPAIVDFDEANGGEWRKSFHGYPHGYAQLVDNPIGFRIEPMQIDTRNRDGSMATPADGFHPDPTLVPKAYAAPLTGPDAVYSGLLECPCTDRITKVIDGEYSLQADGRALKKGLRRIETYTECYGAVQNLSLPSAQHTQTQGSNVKLPTGCSLTIDAKTGEQSVFFNHLDTTVACGGADATANVTSRVVGSAESLVHLTLDLDSAAPHGNVTITVTGPATVWFGVAFGASLMSQQPGAIIVDGDGDVSEYKLGDHLGGTKLTTQVVVLSNTVANGLRTVVLTRGFVGASASQYTFVASGDGQLIPFMNAVGSSANYSFHKAMSSSSILLAKVGVPNCVCGEEIVFGQTKGRFVYTHDDNTTETIAKAGGGCTASTPSDLIPTRNPRCDVTTYVGGLSCCHHQWMLTDRNQRARISNNTLNFRMKVRIWYQEYLPATPTTPASHQQLYRMYHSIAGEYDTVKQTPSHTRKDVNSSNIQVNEFKFQVKDMLRYGNIRTNTMDTPYPTKNQTGIKLMYLNGHCHAAACIQFDLYNDDTGELLCRQQGRAGHTLRPDNTTRFDEKAYIALYPCVYGDNADGLPAPHFLPFDTNLRSVKITNATYTHYGEMAHWQCRGVLA
eukprot:m.123597 g.123597  ORF g.123597 m.123597 type:complete len:807 (-) comp29000_c0_seq2:129-2549(-)